VTDLGLVGFSPRYVAPGRVVFARAGALVMTSPFSVRKRAVTGPATLVLEEVRQHSIGGVTGFSVSQTGTIAYDAGAITGPQAMYVVDRQGTERQLPGPMRMFREPRVSPDGRRIAVRIGSTNLDGGLWIYDIAAGGTLNRLTPDSASIRGEWSRDSTHIVYIDHANSDSERVVSRPWDASGAPIVLARGKAAEHFEISLGPVGGYSAIRRGSTDGLDILLAPSESLAAARPFLDNPAANERDAHISPNGRLLAYTSNESGQNQVYLTPIPGRGPHVPVSIDGGSEPTWARDGTTLFYRSPTRMMAATIAEHPLAVTRRDPLFVDSYRRYPDHAAYDVFPNGREFLMTRGPTSDSKLWVIVNWPQMLGKQSGTGEQK
jgi:Tol biopolymer transport system component